MLLDVEEIHTDSLSFSPFYSLWGKCNGKLNLCSVLLRFLRGGEREVGPLLEPSPLRVIFLMPFFRWTFSNHPFMVADNTGSQREGA